MKSRVGIALAASTALVAWPALAQDAADGSRLAQGVPGAVMLAQATTNGVTETELDDATLLADVLAALPPGVTLDTATDDQIAAAVESVIATQSASAGGATSTPGTPAATVVAAVASRVLSVVSVSLDAIGRGGSASTVTTRVANTLPPQVRAQVQQRVQASRSNPTPSQVAATAVVISQIQPAGGQQQQQQQQVILPIIPTVQGLGQSVFQENPNQVSPT